MNKLHEQDVVTEREIPAARLLAIGWLVLVLVIAATAAWEWRMRALGLIAGDLDDNKSAWSVERRKVEAGNYDGVVIVGGSRILFDTNLDVWQEMTGRRPVQLAMPGMGGRPVLASLAADADSTAWSSSTSRRSSSSAKAGITRHSRACSTTGRTKGRPGAPATSSGNGSRAGSHSWKTRTRSRRWSTRSTCQIAARSADPTCGRGNCPKAGPTGRR